MGNTTPGTYVLFLVFLQNMKVWTKSCSPTGPDKHLFPGLDTGACHREVHSGQSSSTAKGRNTHQWICAESAPWLPLRIVMKIAVNVVPTKPMMLMNRKWRKEGRIGHNIIMPPKIRDHVLGHAKHNTHFAPSVVF